MANRLLPIFHSFFPFFLLEGVRILWCVSPVCFLDKIEAAKIDVLITWFFFITLFKTFLKLASEVLHVPGGLWLIFFYTFDHIRTYFWRSGVTSSHFVNKLLINFFGKKRAKNDFKAHRVKCVQGCEKSELPCQCSLSSNDPSWFISLCKKRCLRTSAFLPQHLFLPKRFYGCKIRQ